MRPAPGPGATAKRAGGQRSRRSVGAACRHLTGHEFKVSQCARPKSVLFSPGFDAFPDRQGGDDQRRCGVSPPPAEPGVRADAEQGCRGRERAERTLAASAIRVRLPRACPVRRLAMARDGMTTRAAAVTARPARSPAAPDRPQLFLQLWRSGIARGWSFRAEDHPAVDSAPRACHQRAATIPPLVSPTRPWLAVHDDHAS
jgi:hypothetical protein